MYSKYFTQNNVTKNDFENHKYNFWLKYIDRILVKFEYQQKTIEEVLSLIVALNLDSETLSSVFNSINQY